MAEEKFKLPLSSYEELVKFIKAYSHVTKPTELGEISKMTGVSAPHVSKNVGFFVATGILEGGKLKMPTQIGRQLGHALEHEMPDEIRSSWRNIVQENEFLAKLLTAVKIRNGMDSQTLEAHIAYSAGQPKKPQFMTGARTVIDILRAAELIVESDGKYLLKEISEISETQPDTSTEAVPIQECDNAIIQSERVLLPAKSEQGYQINIQININCTPDDLSELGTKIKTLINEIEGNQSTSGDE
jgi:hypothetical protein